MRPPTGCIEGFGRQNGRLTNASWICCMLGTGGTWTTSTSAGALGGAGESPVQLVVLLSHS